MPFSLTFAHQNHANLSKITFFNALHEEYDSGEETDSDSPQNEISDQMTVSTLDPDKLSDKEEIKMQKIMESDYSFDFPEFNFVGGEALAYIQDFIEATLHLDTKNRPSCTKLQSGF